ncbi:hypothetical protein [Enterocloster clostridioformis]|uniref:hypothetical protein n=1 Tax=Enterocloster clostridioformis TaxID=1531 RepID=UPI00040DC3D6|nr:hypothetical protein [Enterocloster clostridioformis]
MTDFQAKQIRELRLRGAGYKSIASAVGLSRDTVRNYCKSHGLDGYASALVLNVKEQMESGTACLCCGKELIQPSTGRKRKFCSDKCRREWWSAYPEATMNVMCGIGSGGKKKDGSLMSAPLIVRRYRHECDGMENLARGCIASGSI